MRTDTVDLTDDELAAIIYTDLNGFDGPVSQTVRFHNDSRQCGNLTSSPLPGVPLIRVGNYPYNKDIFEGTLREILA